MTNRLAKETSPYLQQHAHNPVNWFPWGEEALQRAKNEDKPMLVSIGYSACHWCHVMERESFENQAIADVMNKHFVCIKVDREERPDVDSIYMEALQAMGLRGGWPLNVFLMPDAKPFYGGTYFPAANWKNLLESIQSAFTAQREKLQESAEGFTRNLQAKENEKYSFGEFQREEKVFTESEVIACLQKLETTFDYERGGMQRSPKFPMPSVWKSIQEALSITDYQTQSPADSDVVHVFLQKVKSHLDYTLTRIAMGGIYDHLGGGWTRYSTDAEWKVPHFEKMLYDNGQLVGFMDSWAVSKTVTWLERDMTSPKGGFYSAQDADSEGEEGKFYVWTEAEIQQVLGDDSEWFSAIYNIYDSGNWEHGNNVLHLETAPPAADWKKLQTVYDKLFAFRENRIKPGLDDKIICSWNGLMLNGLVEAYRSFGEESYLELALKNGQFIKNNLTEVVLNPDGKSGRGLWRLFESDPSRKKQLGFLEDYAAVIQAFTNLYQVTFDETWLSEAEMLTDYAIANFFDLEEGFFFFTDAQGEQLIARKKEMFDNVIPASNSMMCKNLLILGTILDREDFTETSKRMFAKVKPLMVQDPQWMSNWFSVGVLLAKPIAEIVLVGENIHDFRKEIDAAVSSPNKVFVGTKKESELSLLQNRTAIDGKITIYVCFDKTCQLPVDSVEEALVLIS
jgi:uncharacterized protein YyaL (SSP411 family)